MPTLTAMQRRILKALRGHEHCLREIGARVSTERLREVISKGAHVRRPLEALRAHGLVGRDAHAGGAVEWEWSLTADGRREADELARVPEPETWHTVDEKLADVERRLAAVRQLDTSDVATNASTSTALLRALRDLRNAAYDCVTTANRVADL